MSNNLPTKPTSQSRRRASLDINGLFLRLHTMYGRAWLDMWADAPVALVKAQWEESLERFGPASVQKALAELEKAGKPFPPTLPEMVSLCSQFREYAPPVLVSSDGQLAITDDRRTEMPDHIKALFAKIKTGSRTG